MLLPSAAQQSFSTAQRVSLDQLSMTQYLVKNFKEKTPHILSRQQIADANDTSQSECHTNEWEAASIYLKLRHKTKMLFHVDAQDQLNDRSPKDVSVLDCHVVGETKAPF